MLRLSVIVEAINWWLILSYRAGEFIVNTGISFYEMLIKTVRSLNTVLILLSEGSSLWLQDVHEYYCAVQELIYNGLDYSLEMLTSVLSIIVKILYTPFEIIAAILTAIRQILLLLGSGCLFLISLPPLFLFYFIDTLLHLFKSFTFFARQSAKRLAEHAADIQTLEALLGLVVGCGLIILSINGIKFLGRSYSKLKISLGRGWRMAKTRISTATTRRRNINRDFKLKETELCIICFEHARSVCLLPCRHMCLCIKCTESLPYPLKCPLCRQRAEDLIHVYL